VSPRLHTHTNTWADVSSPAPFHIFQSPQKRSFPPGSPTELLHRERCSISRALSAYLSKSPEKKPPSRIPLQSPYREKDAPSPEPSLHISQSPQKRDPPLGSPYGASTYRKMLHLQSPLCISSKFPRKGAPLEVAFSEPRRNRRSVPRTFLYPSLENPGENPPSRFPIGVLRREMPITRAFYTYHLESPVKERPLQVSLPEPP
jgi:hypothetical protein